MNYRCSMFPFVKVGRGKRYNVHHLNYKNLGSERLWADVICLCPFAHSFIIHGLLSGFCRPSQQKNYPNSAQKIAHFWCCQPVMVRGAVVGLLIVNLVKLVSWKPQYSTGSIIISLSPFPTLPKITQCAWKFIAHPEPMTRKFTMPSWQTIGSVLNRSIRTNGCWRG